jgi:rod shape determining protein RodA
MKQRPILRRFDFLLAATAVAVSGIGVVLISSATHNTDLQQLWIKQLAVLAVGAGLMVFVGLVNFRIFLALAVPSYVIVAALLAVLIILGRFRTGVISWLSVGGISFQPSEFAKIALILILARMFSKIEKERLDLLDMALPLLVAGIPMLLTAAQPDLGTALTMAPLFLGVALVAGLRLRSLIALLLIGLVLFSFAWMFVFKDYQKERLRNFFNPGDNPRETGYQIQQSKIAIGSGGWTGKGLYLGSQSRLNFVPAQHTDFIFSVLGEELGFLGVAGVIALYGLLFARALLPAREIHDVAGIYIIVGIVSFIAFQAVINILMSIGLFPTTGVPLPFLSYGGSSLLTCLVGIGLIISVYAHPSEH